jgi:hypothetical protein
VHISSYFPEAFAFITEARQNGKAVLVHCAAGVSRSVTIVVAYLMDHENKPFEEVFRYIHGFPLLVCESCGLPSFLVDALVAQPFYRSSNCSDVKGKRRIASPSLSFMAQLMQYDSQRRHSPGATMNCSSLSVALTASA